MENFGIDDFLENDGGGKRRGAKYVGGLSARC